MFNSFEGDSNTADRPVNFELSGETKNSSKYREIALKTFKLSAD